MELLLEAVRKATLCQQKDGRKSGKGLLLKPAWVDDDLPSTGFAITMTRCRLGLERCLSL